MNWRRVRPDLGTEVCFNIICFLASVRTWHKGNLIVAALMLCAFIKPGDWSFFPPCAFARVARVRELHHPSNPPFAPTRPARAGKRFAPGDSRARRLAHFQWRKSQNAALRNECPGRTPAG